MDLILNNLQWLIYQKIKLNQNKINSDIKMFAETAYINSDNGHGMIFRGIQVFG